MNILYIHTHDTGRFIEPYGFGVKSPNLLQLSKEGITFRNAYCAGPTCSPSRAGLLTGMAPHSCGMTGLAHLGFKLNDYSKHLVSFLNNKGYMTVLCGVQHEAPSPLMIGYQRILKWHRGQGANTREQDLSKAEAAANFIKEKHDRPFFLSFGMFSTHREFPEKDSDVNADYMRPPWTIRDNAQNRNDMAEYQSILNTADACVGIVLNALKESSQEKNTLVIFTTDHGIAFPRMKCNLLDWGIGVSLIMKCPGLINPGTVTDALVSHIDVYPTVCDIIGVEKPDWLQGKSMISILKGSDEEINSYIFSEVSYHAVYEPMRCVRSNRYKYIQFFEGGETPLPANTDDSPSKYEFLESGYYNISRGREMLFDTVIDPCESNNLAEDPRMDNIKSELASVLYKWMEKTNDPLLTGVVPKPEGAKIFKRDLISVKNGEFEQ